MRHYLYIAFTLLSLSLLSACSKPPVEFKEAIRPIAWQAVEVSNLDQVRRLSGTVQPLESANLSFQVGGKVAGVEVNLGDTVKKGDVLATLDQRSFRLSLQSAQARLQQAQSALTEATNEYNRYKELADKGLVSRSGFDNAKAAFESATSSVNVARAQMNIASKDLQDTTLTAPYNGKITKRLIEPSVQVAPGSPVFEIEGEDGLEVQVLVPETLIRELSQNTQLKITFPVLENLVLDGSISEIGASAQSANAYPVAVLIESSTSELRAGMTAEVDFTFEGVGRTGYRGDIIRVPISSLGADVGQGAYVFVYDKDKQVVNRRAVQTENIIDNEVLVSSGLKTGEIIATAGVTYLRDGQQVTLLDSHIQRFN